MSEVKIFNPNKDLSSKSLIKSMEEYHKMYNDAKEDLEGFWDKHAKENLKWIKGYDKVLDESKAPFYKWFLGGQLNISQQCVDRHLKDKGDKAAILFEGEPGDKQKITYKELSKRVNKAASLLKDKFGVKKGDRVVLYLPMIPELPYFMLACARIGAIHSVVFGGFSAESLRDRIEDARATTLITADGGHRRGAPHILKTIADEALAGGCESIKQVIVIRRNKAQINMQAGRDYWYHEYIEEASESCEVEPMDSEDPLFLLYTSGSTGKPKGVQHSQAGYILWAQLTMKWVFDLKEDDIYWCTADIGWVTGHTYIVYGPLACGGTTIMYEGVPTYPDAGRWWKMVEEYKVNQFYTAPTAIRLLHKIGAEEPKKYDLSSIKILGTVGEPINPDAWLWYHESIGGGRCAIVDTWWQTETGGHMITPLPGATPTKPGSATFPLPGIVAEIIDKDGNPMANNQKGLLCITRPWPSMLRTIWEDPDRFESNYFSQAKKNGKAVYFSGDGAYKDDDGYIWITGRVDDVLNVSGHRIGTAEIESAIGEHDNVAEVAVVGRPDSIKGEAIVAYVVLGHDEESSKVQGEINALLAKNIGAFAKAGSITIVPGLPKTRSGKVMRRLLRAIAKGDEITQDTSTLEDPSIITKIQEAASKN